MMRLYPGLLVAELDNCATFRISSSSFMPAEENMFDRTVYAVAL